MLNLHCDVAWRRERKSHTANSGVVLFGLDRWHTENCFIGCESDFAAYGYASHDFWMLVLILAADKRHGARSGARFENCLVAFLEQLETFYSCLLETLKVYTQNLIPRLVCCTDNYSIQIAVRTDNLVTTDKEKHKYGDFKEIYTVRDNKELFF